MVLLYQSVYIGIILLRSKRKKEKNKEIKNPMDGKTHHLSYRGGGGGGGGTWDFANPTHATIPTARITHPNMSYFRSLLFFFFAV